MKLSIVINFALRFDHFCDVVMRGRERGVDPYWWRVRTDELQFLNKRGHHSARSVESLVRNKHQNVLKKYNSLPYYDDKGEYVWKQINQRKEEKGKGFNNKNIYRYSKPITDQLSRWTLGILKSLV